MALTIEQIFARPTLFFHLTFYTLTDQYFSSWITELLIKILPTFLLSPFLFHLSYFPSLIWKSWQTFSQFSHNLATFSAVWAKAIQPGHIRGGPWILKTSTSESLAPSSSVIEESYKRVTIRNGYNKENDNHDTNLDVSVFISTP